MWSNSQISPPASSRLSLDLEERLEEMERRGRGERESERERGRQREAISVALLSKATPNLTPNQRKTFLLFGEMF